MRVLHLTIAAIQIATVVTLPARSGPGYSTPPDDAAPKYVDDAKMATSLALLVGIGGAAYGLLNSHHDGGDDDGSSTSADNDKRYNREAWTKSKLDFVLFCKFHEVSPLRHCDEGPETYK